MRSGVPNEDDPYLTDSPWEGIPYKRVFEEHDPQTRALIEQYRALSHFHHAETVIDRLEEWRWLDTMTGADEKQAFLEPLIKAIQKDPREHEDKLVFLLIVCEPVRRGVSKQFVRIREGLDATGQNAGPASWHRREEARRLHELDRQLLFDVTREALLDALYRYPTPQQAHRGLPGRDATAYTRKRLGLRRSRDRPGALCGRGMRPTFQRPEARVCLAQRAQHLDRCLAVRQ